MAQRVLLMVALATFLLGAVPESVPVEAQDETITAVGSVTDVPPGGTVNSSRIELRFPASGGQVTGDWNITFTATIGLPFVDEPCTLRTTISGPLEGTYDGRNALSGTSLATNSGTAIARCDGNRTTFEGSDNFSWSAGFDGEQVRVTFSGDELVLTFTAQVQQAAPSPEAPPPVGDVPDSPAGDGPDIAGVFFGTDTAGGALGDEARRLVDCPGPEDEIPFLNCPGALDGYLAFGEFISTFNANYPGASPLDGALRDSMANAVFLAGIRGKDGEPLFPSVLAALPVLAKLADQRTTYAVPGDDPVTAVDRFTRLLAGRDATLWEERFR